MRMKMRLRITFVAAVSVAILAGLSGPAAAIESYTFYGRGTAHGVGLDMSGVQALADQGKGYQEIIKTYYAGVDISGGHSNHWMRIGLLNGGDLQVSADRAYRVFTDGAGADSPTVLVAAGTVTHVSYSAGKYVTSVDNGGTWTKAKHTWFSPTAGGRLKVLNNGRQYRGLIEAHRSSTSGLLWAINVINIEDYVKGIAEEPNSWPLEAQRTLAVASRTYALNKKLFSTKWDSENFDVDATMGSQYYLGLDAERPNLGKAAEFTRGQVVTYKGKVIVAAYHGNSGGHTESLVNVWGGQPGDYPYLRGIPSPWTPVHHWGPMTFSRTQLQDIFNSRPSSFIGTLYSIDFSDRAPSGRLRKVKLRGSSGVKEIWGYSEFKAWLGLPSSLVDVGAPDDSWDYKIMLLNPNDQVANAKLIFMFPTGSKQAIARIIQPNGRATVDVDGLIPSGPVGVKIESDLPVVAERANYFRYSSEITGGHGSLGSKAPAKRWYLSDGRTDRNYDTWISVLNPLSVKARVTATFMPGNGRRVRKTLIVGPQSQKAFYVNRIPGLKSAPVPAVVTADQPVVVERSTYLNDQGYQGGHSTRGSDTLSETWYFAEGYTGADSQTRLQIFNPGDRATQATVWLSKANGDQFKRRVTIGARCRRSILLNRWVSGHSFGIRVIADAPVAAERTVYFKKGGQVGVHSSVGSPVLSKNRYFAGGDTGPAFEEFLTVLNARSERADISIKYFKEGGGVLKTTNHRIPPNSRGTFLVGSAGEAGAGQAVAIRVTSSVPIAAEHVVYFTSGSGGAVKTGGNATLGALSPSRVWFFSEGATE